MSEFKKVIFEVNPSILLSLLGLKDFDIEITEVNKEFGDPIKITLLGKDLRLPGENLEHLYDDPTEVYLVVEDKRVASDYKIVSESHFELKE